MKLNIAHPEQLKRQDIFIPIDVELASTIDDAQTSIELEDATNLPVPVAGPDGGFDSAIRFYIQVEDEIIRYTGRTGNTLTGCVRGSLATLAAPHVLNQVTRVACLKDAGNSLAGKYFVLRNAPSNTKYAFWYSVSGNGSDPLVTGATPVQINITTNASAEDVASAATPPSTRSPALTLPTWAQAS